MWNPLPFMLINSKKFKKKEKREERKKEDSRIAKPTRLQKIFT